MHAIENLQALTQIWRGFFEACRRRCMKKGLWHSSCIRRECASLRGPPRVRQVEDPNMRRALSLATLVLLLALIHMARAQNSQKPKHPQPQNGTELIAWTQLQEPRPVQSTQQPAPAPERQPDPAPDTHQ